MVTPAPVAHTPTRLTPNQIRGFWAAWGGWALDGMDASIYAVVLVPALTELLPRSGLAPTPANVGYYGSVLLALFLFGWGLSMVWGPVADRFGRVRALMLTILSYSLFTFLCALVTNIWQLAAMRVLCGMGIGGEPPSGGTFVAEEWPEDRRKMGAGFMLDRPLRSDARWYSSSAPASRTSRRSAFPWRSRRRRSSLDCCCCPSARKRAASRFRSDVLSSERATSDVGQKDMAIIADFARSVAVATPLFSATVPLYTAAVAMGRGGEDTAAVHAVAERMKRRKGE